MTTTAPNRRFLRDAVLWADSDMTDANPTKAAETTIPVSTDLRDRMRVAKAEEGVAYDTWLRENLPLED